MRIEYNNYIDVRRSNKNLDQDQGGTKKDQKGRWCPKI